MASTAEAQVPVLGEEVGAGVACVGRQPHAVRERHHSVVAALPNVDRTRDRGKVEPPRLDERHVVVETAPVGLPACLSKSGCHPHGKIVADRSHANPSRSSTPT
jgi:hypothetical protein